MAVRQFSGLDIQDLKGKVAVVTEVSGRTGYRIARELSDRNAKVILACENMDGLLLGLKFFVAK